MYQKHIERLQAGQETYITEGGSSMTPIIPSGTSTMRIIPITRELEVGDIVWCKVRGHFYTHKITAIKEVKTIRGDQNTGTIEHIKQYQISNNHGHINGWANRNKIYGLYDGIVNKKGQQQQ